MTTRTRSPGEVLHRRWTSSSALESQPEIPPETRAHLEYSYPHNHDYRIVDGKLAPKCKLWVRLRKLRPLYPQPLTSLLDLSCCKGYFTTHAAQQPPCTRVLGIDIHEPDLAACQAVKAHFGLRHVRYERLRLHELADRIDEFGGPFQTVLLINTYQYFYFGSPRSPDCYLSHDEIFRNIRRVCSGRVIFNNRTELERLQEYGQRMAREKGHENRYHTQLIRDAAAKHFRVTEHGKIGRYPLWTLDVERAGLR